MTTTMRHPDQIMSDFDAAVAGQADIDPREILWEILEDVLDSLSGYASWEFDDTAPAAVVQMCHTMLTDYLVNHYGDN